MCAQTLAAQQAVAQQAASVQDIAEKWKEIEQIDYYAYEGHAALLGALDDFYALIKEFQNSEMYKMYRFVLARPETSRFSTFAYYQLLLVFLIFMELTAFGVRLHYKALLRATAKEEEAARYTQAFFFAQVNKNGIITVSYEKHP